MTLYLQLLGHKIKTFMENFAFFVLTLQTRRFSSITYVFEVKMTSKLTYFHIFGERIMENIHNGQLLKLQTFQSMNDPKINCKAVFLDFLKVSVLQSGKYIVRHLFKTFH